MKVFKLLVAFMCFILLQSNSLVYAANSYVNLGFQSGKFTGWTGYTWRYYGTDNGATGTKTAKVQVSLPNARRQVLISDTTAYDTNTGGALRKVPKGYLFSARLGDEIITSDGKPRGWEQSMQYKLTVDSTNSLLILKFACVLQYASDHTALQEPRFKLTLLDPSGNTISSCTNYDVYSTSGTVKGFQTYTPSGQNSSPVKWRDWTTVGADLSAYKGQNITIEFMSADCTGQYHFGYAYFVADCQSMSISTKYCTGSDTAKLKAPEGFESYKWKNAGNSVVGTNQILQVLKPTDGDTYKCVLTSATGCTDSLTTTIWKYDPKANFSVTPVKCNDSIYQVAFKNLSTTNRGSLSYLWDFGDSTDSVASPIHTFKKSGWHAVSLTAINSSSECTNTKIDSVETFYPPLVGISGDSTYCPGYTTTLKGYGADHYDWTYNGKTYTSQDSIVISAPGGVVAMTGYRSDNVCYTVKRKTVTEEPYWAFTTTPDILFCEGDSVILRAKGASTYLWSSNETSDSIITKAPGVYIVIGTNSRGCEKTSVITVTKDALPLAEFSVSSTTLNTRHNHIDCSISQESSVTYSWDFGDSTAIEQGANVSHTYKNIKSDYGQYKVILQCVNENGCTKISTKSISVVPFIPNVFTPNGDGVNDLFMAGVQLQIFDRYGMKLYDGNTGWNGTYNATKMDNDTYFYVLKFTNMNQQTQALKGYVILKR